MNRCDIEDAELEITYPEGTELECCTPCAAVLTGNSAYIIEFEEIAKEYLDNATDLRHYWLGRRGPYRA